MKKRSLSVLKFLMPTAFVVVGLWLQDLCVPWLGLTKFVFLYPAIFAGFIFGEASSGILALIIAILGARYYFTIPTYSLGPIDLASSLQLVVFSVTGILCGIFAKRVKMARAKERKAYHKMEEALIAHRKTEMRFKVALQAAHMNSWEWDLGSGTFWRSENHDQLFGFSVNLATADGKEFISLVHPEDQNRVRQAIKDALDGRKEYLVEYRVVWKDGTIHWLFTKGDVIRDWTGSPISMSGCTMDITEQKKFQQTLQEAVKSRDEFLSIASHELKTPLTSLQLQTQMYKRYMNRGDKEFFSIERMKKLIDGNAKQIERLSHLIDDMLDIGRISSGKLSLQAEAFDLNDLIKETVERLMPQFALAGCQIEFDSQSGVEGSWDRFRIEQVITNILTNALKYGAGKPILVRLRRGEEKAIISIKDCGMGIAAENKERIFQRFERAVSVSEISGLGLGLYISKKILEMHEGSIRVESELGKGSTFVIELPLPPLRSKDANP